MTTRYAVETYGQLRTDAEIMHLTDEHRVEVAPASRILITPDHVQYDYMCRNGMLQVVTARDDGKLVGYHITIVRPHLHRPVLAGFVDTLYLDPSHRNGRCSMRMIQYAEEMLVRRGVKWISTGVRCVKDFGRLMEHLGYIEAERLYRKEFP